MVTNETLETKDLVTADSSDMQENIDHDGLWKDFIERFLYQLLLRILPELYEAADTTKKACFLDKEFRDILNTGDPDIHNHPNYADFVVEIPLKNADVEWILLHFEAQHGSGEGHFAERMNHYRCLIYAHYRREPVALAIITSGKLKKERFYSHSHFGTEILYRFSNLVLEELDDEELKTSDNIVDIFLYAAKCASHCEEEHQKYKYLRTLTEILSERGWNKDEKRDLLLFIMRVINLKDKMLQKQYWEYSKEIDKEGKLMYVPFLKRIEEEMAEERGKEKMAREMARKLLAKGVSPDIIAQSADMPVEAIQNLII